MQGLSGVGHRGRVVRLTAAAMLLSLGAFAAGSLSPAQADSKLDDLKKQGFARIAIANEPPWTEVKPDGKVTGSVTGVTSRRQFADAGLTQPTGWFDGGVVTFTGGANAGLSREVKSYSASGDQVILQEPFPYDIALSDAYEITAGCDKSFATCGAKFDNVVNFRGFPHVPGIDRMVSGK